jgi:hypothetical protein
VSWTRNVLIELVIEPPLADAQPDATAPARPRDDDVGDSGRDVIPGRWPPRTTCDGGAGRGALKSLPQPER